MSHLEYSRIPIHLALRFAEWISANQWSKHKWENTKDKRKLFKDQGYWKQPYNSTLVSTNDLFIRFIQDNINSIS